MGPCIFQLYVENCGRTGRIKPTLKGKVPKTYDSRPMQVTSQILLTMCIGVNKTLCTKATAEIALRLKNRIPPLRRYSQKGFKKKL